MDFLFIQITLTDHEKYLKPLTNALEKIGLSYSYKNETLHVSTAKKEIKIYLGNDQFSETEKENKIFIPIDHIITAPNKIVSLILSKLNLNKTIFARNCEVKKIDKNTAEEFLNTYHLMNSTNSSLNYGLFNKDELIAVASFSAGRKMNRLPEDKRSFELIRFCSKSGITVTGGLSKLMKHFCREKNNVGDIMTYVDKQFSNGDSFIKAGFKKHSITPPLHFLINKKTFERTLLNDENEKFNTQIYYLSKNSGNLKLIYTSNEK